MQYYVILLELQSYNKSHDFYNKNMQLHNFMILWQKVFIEKSAI